MDFVDGYVSGARDKAETDALAMLSFKFVSSAPASVMKEVTDSMSENFAPILAEIVGYCAPRQATIGQTRDVFCQFLQANPEQRHRPAQVLLNEALTKVWPCKK